MMKSEEDQGCLDILIVEDDDDHARIISRWLSKTDFPFSISRVVDGVEALSFVNQAGKYSNSKRPNVILLDLKLPRLSGHEVLQAIKSNPLLLSIPVVVLTTSDAQKDIDRAYENHANSYLVKPVDGEKFQNLIRFFALYWGQLNCSPLPA